MPKGLRWVVVGVVLASASATPVMCPDMAVAASGIQGSAMPQLKGLRTQVEFWKKVFAVYSSREVVIHDTERLDRIYSVLDFRPLAEAGVSDAEFEAYKRQEVAAEKERVRAMLVRLHEAGGNTQDLTAEEQRIAAMFDYEAGSDVFLDAANEDRVRSQTGLRERFAAGVETSRKYLPEMESIFRREGVPVELTRLPLVESCFNVNAYSKVGAAGIWQFMPTTGRLYMRVDDAVDERRDPITSTAAAAQHLRRDYEALGSWPLAITAYNHGRGGVQRAVNTLGTTDLQEIVKRYHGPAFKFASRNFYAEFLAALAVEQNFEDYFGPLAPHPPQRAEYVVVPGAVRFDVLASLVDAHPEELASLNPALSSAVLSGRSSVPRGYALRVPHSADGVEARYAMLGEQQKPVNRKSARAAKTTGSRGKSKPKVVVVTHRVKAGQTLGSIAKRYGTSIEAIRKHNRLRDGSVRAGQNLVIPQG